MLPPPPALPDRAAAPLERRQAAPGGAAGTAGALLPTFFCAEGPAGAVPGAPGSSVFHVAAPGRKLQHKVARNCRGGGVGWGGGALR